MCQARAGRVEAEMERFRLRAVMLRFAPEPAASRQDLLKYYVQSVQVCSTLSLWI